MGGDSQVSTSTKGNSQCDAGSQNQQPNGQRIEAIKQYYNQLCTNLRHIVNQLNAPEVTPQRKQVLLQQQEQVQKSLQEFTEKVLKPLANAAASNTSAINCGVASAPTMAQQTQPSQQRNSFSSVPNANGLPTSVPSQPKVVTPPQVTPLNVHPPPPMMFQNAPLAVRQALMAIQKQAQQVQQQQVIFQQKIASRSFDSTLHAAEHKSSLVMNDLGTKASGFTLVSSVEAMNEAAGLNQSSSNRALFGRPVSELVSEVDPKLRCTPELEDALLRIADDFIDEVTIFAAKLALHRKDTKIAKKDFEIATEKLFGITLPGSQRNTILAKSVKKLSRKPANGSTSNPHHNRMAQIRKFFASQM